MSASDVQEPAPAPKRPIRMQFMADLELFEWAENRRKEKDVSASEFLYEIVSRQRAAELKVA